MKAMAKKKPVDLAIIFGGGPKKGSPADDSGDDYDDDSDSGEDQGGSDTPAAFESAYDDWKASPGPDTMWKMIRACMDEEIG